VGSGSTTITAAETGAYGLEQATSTVQVTLVTRDLTSLSLLPASQTLLTVGQTTQFTATGTYTTSPTTQDLTAQSRWISSNTSVATINASTGLATATGPGSTTIVATATSPTGSSVVGTATLSVTGSSATGLTSITIIPSSQPITVLGQSAKFVAIGNYTGVSPATQDLTTQAAWSTSDSSVATATSGTSGGVVTATGSGTATVTAIAPSSNGATIVGTATVSVSASAAPGLTAITIIPSSQTVFSGGETSQYIAIGTFTGVTPATQDITNSTQLHWVSSDVQVATINSSGLAIEAGLGTTAITAEWIQTGSPVITGAATFSSAAGGGVTLPILSIYKVGNGAGTTTSTITTVPAPTPPPLNCGTGTSCTGYFPLGTTVTLTVSPVPANFGGWSSNCAVVPGPAGSCTITLNGNEAVGAIFY